MLIERGKVRFPFGDMVIGVNPRAKNPLRVKFYTRASTAQFMSTGAIDRPVAITDALLPEHYETLLKLQEDARKYKEEKDGKIQTDNSREL